MTPTTDLPEVPPAPPQPADIVEPAGAKDPDRAPDWRWQRVLWLSQLRCGKAMSQQEDALIQVGFRFNRAMKKAKTPGQWRNVRESFPELYRAWRLYDLRQDDGAAQKPARAPVELVWCLEAYLCCTDAHRIEIGKSLGMHPACVGFYSKFFFNLDGRRDQTAWMANVACGFNGSERMELSTQWKALGLLGGKEFLDWIFLQGSRQPVGDPRGMASALTQESCLVNAMLAARGAVLSVQERKLALDIWCKLGAMDRTSTSKDDGPSDAENLKVMLSFFKFLVRPLGSAKDLPALEPRATVLLPGAPQPKPVPEGVIMAFPGPGVVTS
jgi:hypothetical protein